MSILYRGLSNDAFYQVSVHLAKWLQRRRFFRNQPIRNKNCLWGAMFVNGLGQNEQSLERTFHICFLHSFTSFGWGVSEEIRLKCEKLTDDRRQMTDAKWWQKLTLPLARWAKNNALQFQTFSINLYNVVKNIAYGQLKLLNRNMRNS